MNNIDFVSLQMTARTSTKEDQSENMCDVCYSSIINGVYSTAGCTYEQMKVSSVDMVEVTSMDLSEQLKALINKNMNLLQKYQSQAQTQTTSDPQNIVRGGVCQHILSTRKDSFVPVMIHSDGISLYKSESCNARHTLGDVLELSTFFSYAC